MLDRPNILSGVTAVAGAINPAIGLATGLAARTGVMGGGKVLAEHLGKNLSHHQVIQAVNQTRIANTPRLDVGKAVLSAMGGHPRLVNEAVKRAGISTIPTSPFDLKAIARGGNLLKHSLSQVSIKSQ